MDAPAAHVTPPLIAALFLVRNEAWCLGASLRSALHYADSVVVYNDRSTDRTPEIIAEVARENPGRVHVTPPLSEDDRRHWPEMKARQATLMHARRLGARFVAINDADEIVCARLLRLFVNPTTRDGFLHYVRQSGNAAALSMLSPYASRWDLLRTDRSTSASQVSWLVNLADGVHWGDDGDGYCHHRRLPRGATLSVTYPRAQGGIFHLQFASRRRLVAKAVWYKLQEAVSFPGRMHAQALNQKYDWALSTENIATESTNPEDLAEPLASLVRYVDFDAEPWQLAEARRLFQAHPRSTFEGINLYEHEIGPLA